MPAEVGAAPLASMLLSVSAMRRFFHALVGWSALAAATIHQIAVVSVAHNHALDWLGHALIIGLSVQLAGVAVIASAARLPARDGAALMSALALALVCAWQLVVWEALFPALFLLLATIDGLLLVLRPGRRALQAVLLLLVLATPITVAALSLTTAPEP
jgi:hypothetical protein